MYQGIYVGWPPADIAGIKRLDSDRKDNTSGCFATIKVKKNPQTVRYYGLGIRSTFTWNCHIFLPIGIIAYAKTFGNMLFLLPVKMILT